MTKVCVHCNMVHSDWLGCDQAKEMGESLPVVSSADKSGVLGSDTTHLVSGLCDNPEMTLEQTNEYIKNVVDKLNQQRSDFQSVKEVVYLKPKFDRVAAMAHARSFRKKNK